MQTWPLVQSGLSLLTSAMPTCARTTLPHSQPSPTVRFIGTLMLVVCSIAPICAGCSEQGEASHARPKGDQTAELSPMLLSEVDANQVKRAEFQIANVKQSPMSIEVLDKSCGCESLEVPDAPVARGMAGMVTMSIRPSASKAEGKTHRATLKLIWHDQTEMLRLRTELQVLADLVTEPTGVQCDFASEDTCERPISVKQRIRSETEPEPIKPEFRELPAEVEIVSLEQAAIRKIAEGDQSSVNGERGTVNRGQKSPVRDQGSVSNRDESRESRGESQHGPQGTIWEIEWRATLRLRATERVREGRDGFVGQCVVACGDGEFSRAQVPIRLRCVEAIQLSTPHTYFGKVNAGELRTRMVLLRPRDGREFEITDVSSESSTFHALATTEGAKNVHMVQVAFQSSDAGKHDSTVHVRTTHPNCPEVSFTVEGSVEENGRVAVVKGQ